MQPTATHRVAWSVSLLQSSALQTWLNRLRYSLECGLRWAQVTMGVEIPTREWAILTAKSGRPGRCPNMLGSRHTQSNSANWYGTDADCGVPYEMGCTQAPPAEYDTTEPSMCSGDVVLCRITLTTCCTFDMSIFDCMYFCSSLSHTCYITRTCSVFTPRLTRSPKRDPWHIVTAHLS